MSRRPGVVVVGGESTVPVLLGPREREAQLLYHFLFGTSLLCERVVTKQGLCLEFLTHEARIQVILLLHHLF